MGRGLGLETTAEVDETEHGPMNAFERKTRGKCLARMIVGLSQVGTLPSTCVLRFNIRVSIKPQSRERTQTLQLQIQPNTQNSVVQPSSCVHMAKPMMQTKALHTYTNICILLHMCACVADMGAIALDLRCKQD